MERTYDLLEDATDFLGAAEDLFKTERWAKVCFNCHQASELAVKAALNTIGLERRGHSITALLHELLPYVQKFKQFSDSAKILDQYYIPTRYANAFYSGAAKIHYTRQQAEEALKYTKSIIHAVSELVAKK